MTFNIKFYNSIFLFTLLSMLVCLPFTAFSQNEECQLVKSKSEKIYTVDSFDVICLAQTSQKEKTLVYTFASWCKPCRHHLSSTIQLAKDYNLELIILLIDEENSKREASAVEYLEYAKETNDANFKTYVLKDENGLSSFKYHKNEDGISKMKYRRFLKQITPDKFEHTENLSKHILIDQSGEVLMVTNWKDREGAKWNDNSKLIENKLMPFLEEVIRP